MLNIEHLLLYLNATIAEIEGANVGILERRAALMAAHDRSIWHRWFGFEFVNNELEQDDRYVNSVHLEQLGRLRNQALYNQKMGATEMDEPARIPGAPDWIGHFYSWALTHDLCAGDPG